MPGATLPTTTIDTPLGPMTATASPSGLCSLEFGAGDAQSRCGGDATLAQIEAELAAYFAGELTEFFTPLAPAGTPFQRQVWEELKRIPFGETKSYATIARSIGAPQASRAVGAANGANPLAIIVPCHRVVRTGGALGGYAGGLHVKRWLLDHERQTAGNVLFLS